MVRVAQQQTAPQPAESKEDIMRKIQELQAQIAQVDMVVQQKAQYDYEDEYEEEYEEVIEEEVTEGEEYEEYEEVYEEVVDEEPSSTPKSKPVVRHHPRPVRNSSGPPPAGHVDYKKQMEALKQKHSFDRPAWAAPAEITNKEEEIDRDSINSPFLKKASGSGYQRQVHEKDLEIIKGTFVKPQIAKVEPRMAWIVVNCNKRKVGKIVMHLYGRDVSNLVDQFIGLKGYDLERRNGNLFVVDVEPAFCIVPGRASGLDSRPGVFGVMMEGRDIFETVMSSAPDAVLNIKQAHIYPVKQSKRGL